MRAFLNTVMIVAALGVPVSAQGPTPPAPPQGRGQNPPMAPAPASGTAPVLPEEVATPPQLVNIKVDLVVVEEGAGDPVRRKEASMILSDRRSGSVRAGAPSTVDKFTEPRLRVDVRPWLEKDGRVRVLVTMQYLSTPHFMREGEQKFELLLESGKTLVVSRATSATSDRVMRVDLTATILR